MRYIDSYSITKKILYIIAHHTFCMSKKSCPILLGSKFDTCPIDCVRNKVLKPPKSRNQNFTISYFLKAFFCTPDIWHLVKEWSRNQGWGPVLAKNRIRGSVPQTEGDYLKSLEWIFLIILKPFFCFSTLVSDVLFIALKPRIRAEYFRIRLVFWI